MLGPAFAQESGQKPAEAAGKTAKEKAAPPEKSASKPELPFQIQLLESHIRFETNGDSRKEVHTIVKINNILGAHEFARLIFNYNRAFQQVEIPLVRISHANGGTSELLPSAVVDAPNPAVEKFPAYQDVRVKSVRILGLEEGDTIEYRVITTTTKHPLAPDFWLEHTFDRSGQVLEERYELDLPASRVRKENAPQWGTEESAQDITGALNPGFVSNHLMLEFPREIPQPRIETIGEGESGRTKLLWTVKALPDNKKTAEGIDLASDLRVSTYATWTDLCTSLYEIWHAHIDGLSHDVETKTEELTRANSDSEMKLRALYDFASSKIATVDLPLAAMGFSMRPPQDTLNSGYGTSLDKVILFVALAHAAHLEFEPALILSPSIMMRRTADPPRFIAPTEFDQALAGHRRGLQENSILLDPGLEVAPFGMIPAEIRGKAALFLKPVRRPPPDPMVLFPDVVYVGSEWEIVPNSLPFAAMQKVHVDASLSGAGELSAKVKYTLRGDNELLLRVAFHQTPKERWKDVAGLLAISDGFRGQVTSVNVSDPMATKDPFTVEYEITQAKFVDWSKKPVRIPALLPQIGLPDAPAKQAAGEAHHAIELGTPLDVDTQMTLKLPAGVRVEAPAGTSVERDYAKFSSKYSTAANTVTASRRVNFLLREIPGDRAMDYSAFVRAVQSDQAQSITLVREESAVDAAKPAKTAPKQ